MDIHRHKIFQRVGAPNLILTSPPYPGVHVLYHRWQIGGRRETGLPYLIANSRDGQGPSFYGFASRTNLDGYFANAERAFSSIHKVAAPGANLVQLVGFSDPENQLPKYLAALARAGFVEDPQGLASPTGDGRLWREVPNRRWYIRTGQRTAFGKEVILFHKKG
jgi:hypothetical protein